MGRQKGKTQSKKQRTSRIWINSKEKTFSNKYRETKKAIKKAQKEPLNTLDLLSVLRQRENFIGVFASDQLSRLRILKYPVFFITNIDTTKGVGSHWIAIRISKNTIEIFDSLGFNPSLWQKYPVDLFNFLGCFSITHRVLISPVIQPPFTHHCGLYSIFFILYRSVVSFRSCSNKFSTDLAQNISKLSKLLLNFFKK